MNPEMAWQPASRYGGTEKGFVLWLDTPTTAN